MFTNQNSQIPGLEGGSVAWADFDGDSDKDMVLEDSVVKLQRIVICSKMIMVLWFVLTARPL